MTAKLVFSALCLMTIILTGGTSKLNVPRILLPIFSNLSVKFILEANDGGCYKWRTTRNDIIKLNTIDENLDNQCSKKVEVYAITQEQTRNIAVVLAEDVVTEEILKCDIILDVIHSLSIATTTRELFMEEVPEVFQVNAYDSFGNEFTSLEGVEFDWNIVSLGPKKESLIVRYLRFKESSYEAPRFIQEFEEANKKGSLILLEGVKTGAAKVSVRLPHAEYQNVPAVEVVLSVIANLFLVPAEVYMMVGDTIKFKLFYMRNGKMEELPVPDSQYYLECENDLIISNEKKSNEVSALALGKSYVLLKNLNQLDDELALKLPKSSITVVQPSYIILKIIPHMNWAILVGDQYEILAEVYSSTDHKLSTGSGVEIAIQVGDGFHVEERARNGSWFIGWGLKECRTVVSARLESVIHPKLGKFTLETPLITQNELFIYPRITINPPEVVLPWDPQINPRYDIELTAKGGDGRFLWSSTDHTLGLVSQTGHVSTQSHGVFSVSAAMTRNHHNRQSCKFLILPPVRLEIVEFVMEAEIFEPIYIHIALYALKVADDNATEVYVPFTQCQEVPFQVKQTDNKFIYNKTASIPPVGVSCANIAVIGTSVGTTKVTISYYIDGRVLQDSVTVSAYTPLKLIAPRFGNAAVMSVGSSLHLLFAGGPRPQLGRQSEHHRIVSNENENNVQVEDVTGTNSLPLEDVTAIWVLCRKLGESNVKLSISNTPSLPNCKSHGSTFDVKIICGKPRRLYIQPQVKVEDTQSCPMDLSADRIIVPKNQNINLDVKIVDDLGRPFLNASSLLFSWESRPMSQIKFDSVDGVITKYEMFGSVPLINKTHQIVRPEVESGMVEVTATIIGYKMSVLKHYRITPELPEFLSGDGIDTSSKITSTIGLFLVDDTVVYPNMTIIFNQPNAKKDIAVMHGSGYIELSLSNDEVASVNYLEGTRVIEIVPLSAGDLTIQLVDLCLISNPIFIYVKVVSLGKIEVETVGKVEVNHCIEVIVRLYDEAEQLLDIHDAVAVDLKYNFSVNIGNIGRMPQNNDEPWPSGEIHFVLTGVEGGDTQLMFTFDNKNDIVKSDLIDIQVFPPLRVNPRNGTILIGSPLQLTMAGGPHSDASIQFEPLSNTTVIVSELGIVIGRNLGFTRITVKSVGIHPKTGEKVELAEDTIDVNVIRLTGIKIGAPLTRFKTGSSIPVWITGIPETITPLILSTFEDSLLTCDWYFNDYDVATSVSVFSSVGIIYKNSDKTMIRVTGLQPGKTKLMVNVSYIPTDSSELSANFFSFVDLEVFEPLQLINPKYISGRSLLMARHTSVRLETNLDGIVNLEYSIPEHQLMGTEISALNSTSLAIITVTETGHLQSYGTVGFAQLLITATSESGLKQTLTYVVEVKPVHYMLLTVKANWRIHLDSSLQVIPLGTEFHLIPTFYDSVGNKFNAGPRQVKVRASRLDLIKIKQYTGNTTVTIATKKAGHTVIKGWTDGVDKTADYIKIHSKEVIKPIVDFLTSGDIICLWSPVVTKSLQIGTWSSSDNTMISIDQTIDLAFVIGNKEGTVLLSHSLHSNVPLRIQVLPIAEVILWAEKVLFLTNGVDAKIQQIGVALRNRMGPTDKTNNLIQGWLCDRSFSRYTVPTPFRCFIRFTNETLNMDANRIFDIKSNFQPETGQYNCKITSVASNISDISLFITNVSIWVISDDGEIESEILELPFIPTPYSPSEIYIGDQGNAADLIVVGLESVLKQVVVQAADPSVIYVDNGHLLDANRKLYRIQLIDYHPKLANHEETMTILVRSPLTEQTTKVLIKVSNSYRNEACPESSALYRFISQYKHAIIVIVSMIIVFCLTCYVYSRYMQPVVSVNITPNRSMLTASNAHYPVYLAASTSPTNRNMQQQSFSRMNSSSPVCTNKNNCTCKIEKSVYGDNSPYNMSNCQKNRRFL